MAEISYFNSVTYLHTQKDKSSSYNSRISNKLYSNLSHEQ